MQPEIRKYVRTPHIRGSRFQSDDHDMEAVAWEELAGKHLVIEEKVDGANCGVSFDTNGDMYLQSRGHYLRGGPREKHFNLLKQWTACKQEELYCILGDRYVMYAEWLLAKHTVFYDALPHYFMEFDILDKKDNVFLSTSARARVLNGTSKRSMVPVPGDSIVPVLVLAEGKFKKLDELKAMIVRSNFITDERLNNLTKSATNAGVSPEEAVKHTDMSPLMEGLYVKWEEDGEVKGRYKFVRESFTNSILEQETHWHDRPIVENGLLPGALEKMFS